MTASHDTTPPPKPSPEPVKGPAAATVIAPAVDAKAATPAARQVPRQPIRPPPPEEEKSAPAAPPAPIVGTPARVTRDLPPGMLRVRVTHGTLLRNDARHETGTELTLPEAELEALKHIVEPVE